MKILYLNVNGFFGDSSIKTILVGDKNDKNMLYKVRECRKDGLNKIISKLLVDKLKSQEESYGMIFLSEIDPHSEATIEFKEKMENNNYTYILPNAVSNEDNIKNSRCISLTSGSGLKIPRCCKSDAR